MTFASANNPAFSQWRRKITGHLCANGRGPPLQFSPAMFLQWLNNMAAPMISLWPTTKSKQTPQHDKKITDSPSIE